MGAEEGAVAVVRLLGVAPSEASDVVVESVAEEMDEAEDEVAVEVVEEAEDEVAVEENEAGEKEVAEVPMGAGVEDVAGVGLVEVEDLSSGMEVVEGKNGWHEQRKRLWDEKVARQRRERKWAERDVVGRGMNVWRVARSVAPLPEAVAEEKEEGNRFRTLMEESGVKVTVPTRPRVVEVVSGVVQAPKEPRAMSVEMERNKKRRIGQGEWGMSGGELVRGRSVPVGQGVDMVPMRLRAMDGVVGGVEGVPSGPSGGFRSGYRGLRWNEWDRTRR